MHNSETFKGFITATAVGSSYAWLTDSVNWSTICLVGSLATAAIGWYVLRKEKQADLARSRRVEDALSTLQVNNIEIAVMIDRILHPDMLQPKPKPEVKE